MPPGGFEPATPVSDRPHTVALDRSATMVGGLEKEGKFEESSLLRSYYVSKAKQLPVFRVSAAPTGRC